MIYYTILYSKKYTIALRRKDFMKKLFLLALISAPLFYPTIIKPQDDKKKLFGTILLIAIAAYAYKYFSTPTLQPNTELIPPLDVNNTNPLSSPLDSPEAGNNDSITTDKSTSQTEKTTLSNTKNHLKTLANSLLDSMDNVSAIDNMQN